MAKDIKWFTKTIAREEITTLANSLIDSGDITSEIAKQFIDLFASKRSGGGVTTSVSIDGVVVGKRCSFLGRYLPISDFGTVGKNDDGSVKYGYQSKEGSKLSRSLKTAYEEAIAQADLELDETENVQGWKEAKLAAKEVFEAEVVSELGYETEAEFLDALGSIDEIEEEEA